MRVVPLVFLVIWSSLASQALADDADLCRAAVSVAETSLHIPDAFLSAIARVESGRPDPRTGAVAPWPWTINAEGQGSFFASKAEAIGAVRALQARGVRSIDVGCLQVNLMHHPEAFASLDQAFDPASNANFAGRFLLGLFAQTHAWPRAAAAYHSQTPTVGAAYQQRVLAEWSLPQDGTAPAEWQMPARPRHDPAPETTAPLGLAAAASPASPAFGRTTAFAGRASPAASELSLTGRGLAAYRALPTFLATRWVPRPS